MKFDINKFYLCNSIDGTYFLLCSIDALFFTV